MTASVPPIGTDSGNRAPPRAFYPQPSPGMRFQPWRTGRNGRINLGISPGALVAAMMDLTVIRSGAKFVADLAPEGPALRKPQMMGVGTDVAADRAGLLGVANQEVAAPRA